jgi:hypothetical protein
MDTGLVVINQLDFPKSSLGDPQCLICIIVHLLNVSVLRGNSPIITKVIVLQTALRVRFSRHFPLTSLNSYQTGKCNKWNELVLSRVLCSVDGVWIDGRIYWTPWYSAWLHFIVHFYPHRFTSANTSVQSLVFTDVAWKRPPTADVTFSLGFRTAPASSPSFQQQQLTKLKPSIYLTHRLTIKELTDWLTDWLTDCNQSKSESLLYHNWRSVSQSVLLLIIHLITNTWFVIAVRKSLVCWCGVSFLKKGRVLQFLLTFASPVILGIKSCGTHDHILLFLIRDLPAWKAKSLYSCHPRTAWPCSILRHWVPFSSPPMTRRATVEVLEPVSMSANWPFL